VDELYLAMLDVGTDVMERHPRLMQRRARACDVQDESNETVGNELLCWDGAVPFELFAQFLQHRDAFEIKRKVHQRESLSDSTLRNIPAKLLLMEPAHSYRGEGSISQEVLQLQDRLRQTHLEIMSLKEELGIGTVESDVSSMQKLTFLDSQGGHTSHPYPGDAGQESPYIPQPAILTPAISDEMHEPLVLEEEVKDEVVVLPATELESGPLCQRKCCP